MSDSRRPIDEVRRDSASIPYDAIVIGGGPAGLNAALVLARCRRRVLLCDDARPRNEAAQRLHNFLTRDGMPPHELLRLAREEVERLGVTIVEQRVISARCDASGSPSDEALRDAQGDQDFPTRYTITLQDGRQQQARKLLLATGVRDVLPEIPGLRDFYGRGVHHCPYCDGLTYQDKHLVAFGGSDAAIGLALALRTWSSHITVCTNGRSIDDGQIEKLRRLGIACHPQRVARLNPSPEDQQHLGSITFEDDTEAPCDALFFNTEQFQHSGLPTMLGCPPRKDHQVETDRRQRTEGPRGLFLAGDADGQVQFAIVAAAEGATAAVMINHELQEEDTEAVLRTAACSSA